MEGRIKQKLDDNTIGAKRGAGDGGELLAGVDVLEDSLVKARQMLVPFLQHRLDAIGLQLKPHSRTRDRERKRSTVSDRGREKLRVKSTKITEET